MVACGVLRQDIWVRLLPCWIAGSPARNNNSPSIRKEGGGSDYCVEEVLFPCFGGGGLLQNCCPSD